VLLTSLIVSLICGPTHSHAAAVARPARPRWDVIGAPVQSLDLFDAGASIGRSADAVPLPAAVLTDTLASSSWWTTVQEDIRQSEYNVTWQKETYPSDVAAAYQAPNRAQDLRAYFIPGSVRIIPRAAPGGWELGLSFSSYGYAGQKQPVQMADLVASGNRIDYRRGGVTEWYLNAENGLKQGFVVSGQPSAVSRQPSAVSRQPAQFTLDLALTGDLTPRSVDGDQAVEFTTAEGVRALRYGDLHATDATDHPLPAYFSLSQVSISIWVDDANAVYPLTIEATITGLSTTPDWTAESDQAGAEYGIEAATAGDVNGDGYSDVIVGAYKYDNGETDEGRAFVYYGSAAGLSPTPDWMAESDQAGAWFGYSVDTAGDVNGDGYPDVIVGARYYSGGQEHEGRAYVYYGSAAGLSATPAWTAESDQAGAILGNSVGTAGDVNGDGYDDVIVAPFYYDHGQTDEGVVYVYHGSATGLSTTANWMAESNQSYAYFGASVGTAGDVNGDGYADVIIGAYLYDNGQTDEGRAFVYLGSAAGLGPSAAWTAESNQANAYFSAVSTAGDVNGDGYADVIVGAYRYDNGQTDEGRAFLYHGSASGLSLTANWTAESDQSNARFGGWVSTVGDVNGDGYADVIVGAEWYDNGQTDEGAVFVYYGSSTGPSATTGWTVEGEQSGANFGLSADTAGDVNGDGYSDVIVGARYYDNGQTDEGAAFVYHGGPDGLTTSGADWMAESDQAGADFGFSVDTARDVNGDGYSDVIVGARLYDNGQTDEGRVFVYHGSAIGLNTTADWTAESDQVYARFGVAVSTAGDVNGDGYADVIVGAYYYDDGQTDEGRAYVYHGSASGLNATAAWMAASDQVEAHYGNSVSTAGDVNGDGYSDVIVTAYDYDNGQTDEGRAYVYHGSATGLSVVADWTVEGDQTSARFGLSAGAAGDVNGDGCTDVIVSALWYDNGQMDEGRVFVYHGSASGLSTTANWMAESDQVEAYFGHEVDTAGDVNGDGYADVIVGAYHFDSGQTDEGRAYVYHGSATGLDTSPAWTADGNQASAVLGDSVSTAGDVNGDGYADVIVGARMYDNGQTDEGRAFVYHGSATGLSLTPDWTAEGDQVDARFGVSVRTAGDVNGDGYADVIIGANEYDDGQTDEGAVFLYYGNGGDGLDLTPRQLRTDGSVHIAPLGMSDAPDAIQLRLTGRMPLGREQIKLQWQVAPLGAPFTATNVVSGTSAAWTDTLTTGMVISQNVTGLTPGTPYHWRVRLLYRPGNRLGQPAGRWIHIPWNGWTEQDLRTPAGYVCTPETRDSDVVLVVDRSGSMGDDGKLAAAQAAVSTFLDTLSAPPEQAALVSFASGAALNEPLTTDVEAVRAAVMALTAGGDTRIDLGLEQARLELAGPRHVITHTQIIILLSDGQQTGSTDPVLAEAAAAKAAGALIFTIGLGPDADGDLLSQVASQPEYYFYAPSGDELEDIYLEISTVLACPDIGGRVFVDWNVDGMYSAGLDEPLGDVEIELAGGSQPQTAVSDPLSGTYLFAANPSGQYTLTVDLDTAPAGYQPTTDTVRYVDLHYRAELDNDFGFLPPAGLALSKEATPTGLPNQGGWVTYTFQVDNLGQTPLSPVTVTDPLLGGLVCTNPPGQDPLLPGDSFACQTTALILTDTVNLALATGVGLQPNGEPIPGGVVSDTAQATVALVYSALGGRVFADWDQDGQYTAGTDAPLVGVEIELQGAQVSDAAASAAPDGYYLFPANVAGVYTLTADLSSAPPGYQATTPITRQVTLTLQDQLAHDFGFFAPSGLSLTKTADPSQLPLEGGWVTFTFQVSNTGQTPLSPVTVTDPLLGGPVCIHAGPLSPDAGFACQVTALILTDTLNVATVSGVPLQVDGQPIPGQVATAADWAVVTLGETEAPLLTIDKDVLTPAVTAGGEVTYTIVVRNVSGGTANGVWIADALPGAEWTFLGDNITAVNAERTQAINPQVGDYLLEWGEWILNPLAVISVTFRVQVGPGVAAGSYDNTAAVESQETGWTDDEGEVGGDPGAPAGADPETDEDVSVVSPGPEEYRLYLPVVMRNYTPPITFPLHIGDLIVERPVAYQGEVFYTKTLQMPDELPASGRFYLSSEPDAVAEVVVDDAVMIFFQDVLRFTYVFSDGTYVPVPAIVELPRTTMEALVGQTVTVEYRDVYAVVVRASPMWLIWTP
jgi:uncharacterized repeat protein (TIGR01451 family)